MRTAALQPAPQAACPAAGSMTKHAIPCGPSKTHPTACGQQGVAQVHIGCTGGESQLQAVLPSHLLSPLSSDLLVEKLGDAMASTEEELSVHQQQQQQQQQQQKWKATQIQRQVYAFKADLLAAMKDEDDGAELTDAQRDAELAAVPDSLPRPRLTEEDLVQWFHDQCYPGKAQRIGMECEQFVVHPETGRRAEIKEVQAVLQGLVDRYGWQPVQDPKHGLVSVRKDGHVVDFEAGGQLELSAPPVDTVWDIAVQMDSFKAQLEGVLNEHGLVAVCMGYDPINRLAEVPLSPRERAQLMAKVLPQIGSTAMDIQKSTCAIQVSLDYMDEADMVRKMRVGLGLQPVAVALSACSPFQGGRPSGFLSHRAEQYMDYDSSGRRTGIVPVAFHTDMGFARYVRHAMEIPMLLVRSTGGVVPCLNQRWTDFMQGRLPALPGRCPTMTDWQLHLGTTWPEVRLKSVLEMRGADCGPQEMNLAMVALWVGLLYCPKSLAAAEKLVCSWTAAERDDMYTQVPKLGLQTPLREGKVLDVAKQVVAWAREGLVERGHGEETFLRPLEQVVATGKCPADHMLDAYYGSWGQSVHALLTAA